MIRGALAGDHRPYIRIVIAWTQGVQELLVLIDTGFNGELKIPEKMVKELGLTITHIQDVLLANETTSIQVPSSLAFVSLEDVAKEVNVLITGKTPTIGTKLLREFGYKLTVDFKTREVFLEK